jgi:hypothetical protein
VFIRVHLRFKKNLTSVLLTRKIVKLFTMFSGQRERIETNRAAARTGWRPSRPLVEK